MRRRAVVVAIKCDKHSTEKLRYRMDRPTLDSESTITGVRLDWKGRFFRWGKGLSMHRTRTGVVVTASERFWGKLRWVKKVWTIRTEY